MTIHEKHLEIGIKTDQPLPSLRLQGFDRPPKDALSLSNQVVRHARDILHRRAGAGEPYGIYGVSRVSRTLWEIISQREKYYNG